MHLASREESIDHVSRDLATGVKLCSLVEILSGKGLPRRYVCGCKVRAVLRCSSTLRVQNKNPKFSVHKMENVNLVLRFLMDEGVRLPGTGAEGVSRMRMRVVAGGLSAATYTDIVEQNLNMTLGLVWVLILHYQVTASTIPDFEESEPAPAPASPEKGRWQLCRRCVGANRAVAAGEVEAEQAPTPEKKATPKKKESGKDRLLRWAQMVLAPYHEYIVIENLRSRLVLLHWLTARGMLICVVRGSAGRMDWDFLGFCIMLTLNSLTTVPWIRYV